MASGYIAKGTGNQPISARGRARMNVARPHFVSRRARLKTVLAWTILSALSIAAIISVAAVWRLHRIYTHLPSVADIADIRLSPETRILSEDGVVLATLETQYRRPVPLDHVAKSVIDATLAVEDSRFFEHSGIDWRGIGRAIVANVRRGNAQSQGASTITQQLARNLYLTSEKTLTRKVEEAMLARKIEETYSKHDILEAYLNTVYYGSGSYGIEAAAQTYFGKSASQLNLGEAALLAGLPQRPGALAPNQHMDAAMRRRSVVIARMLATGRITPSEATEATGSKPRVLPLKLNTKSEWRAPYFVKYVLNQLKDKYGDEFLYSGADVVTTLDWRMQKSAESALNTALTRGHGPTTGALVTIDPRSGHVRALVGGADFRTDQFDAATQGIRQPGSAFKPIVYACAFSQSLCDLSTMIDDTKLVYPNYPHDWTVHNFDGRYRGPVTVLDAIRDSINTVAVQVGEKASPIEVIDYAKRLGISTPLDPVLPLALGASGVRPIDLCSAYTAFANDGSRLDPSCILRITDNRGNEIFTDTPADRAHPQVVDSLTRDQINVALREVVLSGTGAAAASIPDAHGKTGTTSNRRDAWFVGYTRDLATVVWMAKPIKRPIPGSETVRTEYLPMDGATGGHLCAPVWRDFMRSAIPIQQKVNRYAGIPVERVSAPDTQTMLASLKANGQDQEAADAQEQAANQEDPAFQGHATVNSDNGVAVVYGGSGPIYSERAQPAIQYGSVTAAGDGSRSNNTLP